MVPRTLQWVWAEHGFEDDPVSLAISQPEALFLAAMAERTLVNDALSGDTFCAEMLSTRAAQSSVFVTNDSPTFFADRLSSVVAQIALPRLIPNYLTRRRLENLSIGTTARD